MLTALLEIARRLSMLSRGTGAQNDSCLSGMQILAICYRVSDRVWVMRGSMSLLDNIRNYYEGWVLEELENQVRGQSIDEDRLTDIVCLP